MLKNEYNVIGVMSGTSLDGVDLAFITFTFNGSWSFKIHNYETVAYSEEWLLILKHLIHKSEKELHILNEEYTVCLATIINNFIEKYKIKTLDAICSHGHTALHQPDKGLTLQIGNLPVLSKLVKSRVVCDFRVQDVKLGGQGAPLVPIGDALLFNEYDFCINLGGFANLSTVINNDRIAYDICPVNIVLNHYVNSLGLKYDDKGKLASEGIINNTLLKQLNALPFYKEQYPKSLGLEWVNNLIFPLIDETRLDMKDLLRTFVEHIAIQITLEVNKKVKASVLLTGGGVYNTFLINRIKALTSHTVITPSKEIMEYKEALIFGLLGILKLRNETNVLASVTGAVKDHCSGKVYNS